MEPDAYTVEQVAAKLQMSKWSAYEAIRQGQIPAIRVGRLIRVPRRSFEQWLETAQEPDRTARTSPICVQMGRRKLR